MEDLPQTMRSLVAPRARCTPADYLIQDMPVPSIAMPTQVLMRMHAASVGPGELQAMAGFMGRFVTTEYPFKIGAEGSGTVVAVGSEVKALHVGDEVYGLYIDKPMFRLPSPPGFVSDYAVAEERFLLRKPPTMSWEEAAGAPGSVVTALQTIRRGLQLGGLENLEGKTVFVPAALGATGSVAIQVAKNVFGAARIITTVSTAKVPLVERYLPGMVDQVIDYQTQKIRDVVPPGSVDFMYNTTFATLDDGIPLLNPTTGILMSIASLPSKAVAREIVGADRFPWLLGAVLDLLQLQYWWKLRGTGIRYEFVSGGPQIREDLEWAGEVVARGKVKPVVTSVDFDDLPAVQKGCEATRTGKGGIGKFAMRIK
ncbi:alcohol dehydrogenase GroES-like domain-containing protein [Purpureocillium lilacinum]|uniref:alcohol dehydrogenase GroES-like domain-containing protein n=1 Tax=Purpureocillium lilacinum TaxID=33203 RepID=UPI00207ED0D1|nr:alcohol dehydrogenase GroES-like domain-containing protein [Purpureocillium lilacinum]GJN79730.1 alcohol dehydrogenase GroES-like domain-containing protein [Purpureocillium lilacinum]